MLNLQDFIGPIKTPAMRVDVIDENARVVQRFHAPEGFQLERYVDALFPENELFVTQNLVDITVSVVDNSDIAHIYRGVFK